MVQAAQNAAAKLAAWHARPKTLFTVRRLTSYFPKTSRTESFQSMSLRFLGGANARSLGLGRHFFPPPCAGWRIMCLFVSAIFRSMAVSRINVNTESRLYAQRPLRC